MLRIHLLFIHRKSHLTLDAFRLRAFLNVNNMNRINKDVEIQSQNILKLSTTIIFRNILYLRAKNGDKFLAKEKKEVCNAKSTQMQALRNIYLTENTRFAYSALL